MAVFALILLSTPLGVTSLASTSFGDRIGSNMATKPYDLTDAVTYHVGAFPPATLDYEAVLGPLEEAAASLARYATPSCEVVYALQFIGLFIRIPGYEYPDRRDWTGGNPSRFNGAQK